MKSKMVKCLGFCGVVVVALILINLNSASGRDYYGGGIEEYVSTLPPQEPGPSTTYINSPAQSGTPEKEKGEEVFKSKSHVVKHGTATVSEDLLDDVRATLEGLIKDILGYCSDEILNQILKGNEIQLGDIDIDGDGMPDITITYQDVTETTKGKDGKEVTKSSERISITRPLAWGSDVAVANGVFIDYKDGKLADVAQVTVYTKIGANGLPVDSLMVVHSTLNDEDKYYKITRTNMSHYGVDGSPDEYDDDQEEITENEAWELLEDILGLTAK